MTDSDDGGNGTAARALAAIANSGAHSRSGRRSAVLELFTGHVSAGMTARRLAELLDGAPWLRDEDVTVVEDVAGYIPVAVTHDNTVFVIEILPDDDPGHPFRAVFLSVDGHVDRGEFVRLLHGEPSGPETERAKVLEVSAIPADPAAWNESEEGAPR